MIGGWNAGLRSRFLFSTEETTSISVFSLDLHTFFTRKNVKYSSLASVFQTLNIFGLGKQGVESLKLARREERREVKLVTQC